MKMTRRRVLGLLAGAAAVVGVPSVWITRMKTYDGPASDHFNGTHFFDPDGSPPKSLGEVLRWQFGPGRKRAAWPEWMASPHADTPPPRVNGEKLRLSFVGHASWLIQTSGLNILIDPVWSPRASPLSWAGAEASQRSRHCVRRAAADRRRAGVAWTLRSSRRRDAVEARRKVFASRYYAARQRCHHAQRRRRDQGRGVRLA